MAERKNTYELTYILNAVLNEGQLKDLVQRVNAYITENGGNVLESDEWGQRRLAYPIEKRRNGYYVNVHFEADPALVGKLERALQINEDVMRYLTLKLDAKMLRHYEQQKTKAKEAPAEQADA